MYNLLSFLCFILNVVAPLGHGGLFPMRDGTVWLETLWETVPGLPPASASITVPLTSGPQCCRDRNLATPVLAVEQPSVPPGAPANLSPTFTNVHFPLYAPLSMFFPFWNQIPRKQSLNTYRGSIWGRKASLSSSREAHCAVSAVRNSSRPRDCGPAGKELSREKVLVKSAPAITAAQATAGRPRSCAPCIPPPSHQTNMLACPMWRPAQCCVQGLLTPALQPILQPPICHPAQLPL